MFMFFKQKTAYEMRISDWSSDVCSSDLRARRSPAGLFTCGEIENRRIFHRHPGPEPGPAGYRKRPMTRKTGPRIRSGMTTVGNRPEGDVYIIASLNLDRKSVVKEKREAEPVDLGGRRLIKKQQKS